MVASTYLGESMSSARLLSPGLVNIGSSLDVKLSKVKVLSSLLDILVIIGGLLGFVSIADFLILRGSQSCRNV
jgi:hypothetical protein